MTEKKYFLKDFQEGMSVIFKHLFKPTVTMEYPDQKWKPYARFRGAPGLYKEKCAVCCMCTNVCPSKAIKIVGQENEKGEKIIKTFEIDVTKCLYCGLCADFCPREAIVLTSGYELCVFDKKELKYDLKRLEENAQKYAATEEGGFVVKAK